MSEPITKIPISRIAKALYVINLKTKVDKHAAHFYSLKKEVLEKLVEEGSARKVGLQFYSYTKRHDAALTVLIQIDADDKTYFFHALPTPDDIRSLPNLGESQTDFRNPSSSMRLEHAKYILCKFCGRQLPKPKKRAKFLKIHRGSVFKSSFLD
ncbi:MAG: YkyB family protein [Anaerobacillus sp.]|uniref:YkyB family protein n=1 Tax=Anaerobacillus sp. TaxID=1872506 RepID=UPI00391B1AE7